MRGDESVFGRFKLCRLPKTMVIGAMTRFAHDFLKWFPAAVTGTVIATATVWAGAKDWIASQVAWAWFQLTEPWVAISTVLMVAAYAAAIIITGRKGAEGDQKEVHIHHHYATLQEMLPQSAIVIPDNSSHRHIAGSLNLTEEDDSLSASVLTSLQGIYVGYVIVSAGRLEGDRRLDFAIVGYNGSGDTIRVANVEGRIRAGTGNLRDYCKLETPLFQGVLNAEHGKEFVLQMRQDVGAEQAEEFLVALGQMETLGLDLRGLDILIASVSNPEKCARLPLWDGVNLRRRDDVVSNRNTIHSISAAIEANVSLGLR